MTASDAHPSVDEAAHAEAGCKLPLPLAELKLAPYEASSADFSMVMPGVLTDSPLSNLHPWPSYGDAGGAGAPTPTHAQEAMRYFQVPAPWQVSAPERAGFVQQQGQAQLVPKMGAQEFGGSPHGYGLSSMWAPVQNVASAPQQSQQQKLLVLPACAPEPQVPAKRTALSSKAALWQPKSAAAAAAPPSVQQREPATHPIHMDDEGEDLWQRQAKFLEQQMESVRQRQLELFTSCGEEERQQVLELLRRHGQAGVEAAKAAVVQLEPYQGQRKFDPRGGGGWARAAPDPSEHSDESDFLSAEDSPAEDDCPAPAAPPPPWAGRRFAVSWAEMSCDGPEDQDLDFFGNLCA